MPMYSDETFTFPFFVGEVAQSVRNHLKKRRAVIFENDQKVIFGCLTLNAFQLVFHGQIGHGVQKYHMCPCNFKVRIAYILRFGWHVQLFFWIP